MNLHPHEEQIHLFGSIIEEFNESRMASLKDFLANIERSLIIAALNKTNGDQKRAARILGLKNTTLHEKIKRYHIHLRKIAI